jgi:hypothetical protein
MKLDGGVFHLSQFWLDATCEEPSRVRLSIGHVEWPGPKKIKSLSEWLKAHPFFWRCYLAFHSQNNVSIETVMIPITQEDYEEKIFRLVELLLSIDEAVLGDKNNENPNKEVA